MIRTIAIAAAAQIALAATPATALGISQAGFSLISNGSMPACLQRAREVLERGGLRVLNTGSSSVGAEPQDGSALVTAFCLPSANMVVMTAAGQDNSVTAPLLERLRATMQQPTVRPTK